MEDRDDVFKVVKICLDLDRLAYRLYSRFADGCVDPELKRRWEEIAADEKEHMAFWKGVLQHCANGIVKISPSDPDEFLQKLHELQAKTEALISRFGDYGNTSEELTLAYTLEAFLLDPYFMEIFHAFGFVEKDMEEDYREHIRKFKDIMTVYCAGEIPLHMEMMADVLFKLHELNCRLCRESATDPLTGLLNRRGFFNTAVPCMSMAARLKRRIGLIMCDLDNFKTINDRFGHQAGDCALRAAGCIISSSLRKADVSGRYGGEEFIVLLDSPGPEELAEVCERIRDNIEKKSGVMGGVPFTISIGAVVSDSGEDDVGILEQLISLADSRLRSAKESGKNRCVVN